MKRYVILAASVALLLSLLLLLPRHKDDTAPKDPSEALQEKNWWHDSPLLHRKSIGLARAPIENWDDTPSPASPELQGRKKLRH